MYKRKKCHTALVWKLSRKKHYEIYNCNAKPHSIGLGKQTNAMMFLSKSVVFTVSMAIVFQKAKQEAMLI